jgi:hypothetical protein
MTNVPVSEKSRITVAPIFVSPDASERLNPTTMIPSEAAAISVRPGRRVWSGLVLEIVVDATVTPSGFAATAAAGT